MKASHFKSTFRQGVILGLGFCLYTTLMWLTNLDTTYLRFGQYLDMAIVLLPIGIILWAIQQENDVAPVGVLQRMGIAIYVGAISFLLYDPFLYVYHHYINPEWFTSVLNLKEAELKAANMPPEKILETLRKMKNSGVARAGLFTVSAALASAIVLPTLVALLSIPFIKRKGKLG